MATSTMAADASAGATAAEIEAAFLDGAEDAASNGGAYPSDEAILGIEDGMGDPSNRDVILSGARQNVAGSEESVAAGRRRAAQNRGIGSVDADAAHRSFVARQESGELLRMTTLLKAGRGPQDDKQITRGGEADSFADSDDARGGVGATAAGAAAPAMPEWLAQVGAKAPSASAELGALWQRATQLDAFDRAYYGDDAGAQQELVSALYAENPGALRAMFAAAANVLHGGAGNVAPNGAPGTDRRGAPRDRVVLPERVAQGLGPAVFPPRAASADLHDAPASDVILSGARQNVAGSEESVDARRRVSAQSDGLGSADANAAHRSFVARQNQRAPQDDNQIMSGADGAAEGVQRAAREASRDAGRAANAAQRDNTGAQGGAQHANADAHGAAQFDAGAYANFERATNDAVVSDVTRAIERTLDHALPAGIADGARRRIAGDTLNEVHAALRGDRQLSAQVAEALRTGRFDDAAREQVSRLIASRARGVVPAAAKRVIGEWTGSVLATHRERAAKQQSTQSRVDITGGGLPQPVPRRTVRPSDVDYRATSDEEILSW